VARPRKNEETTSPWVVRDVPEYVRRKVRVYAAMNDMTMAQAIEDIVNTAFGILENGTEQWQREAAERTEVLRPVQERRAAAEGD
jgi:hypothetical protein